MGRTLRMGPPGEEGAGERHRGREHPAVVSGQIGAITTIFPRKWSRATLQLYWYRSHRLVNPAMDLLRDGVLHRCGESHHSPIADTPETKFH